MAKRTVTVDLKATGNAPKQLGLMNSRLSTMRLGMLAVAGAAAGVAVAVGKFVTDGIKVYAEFDQKISEIKARTSLTGEEMKKVSEFAKQMGRETSFSATDAADSMLELITSGSDAAEAMELLPHVMNLAAAGGVELEQAADILTNVMKQFGLDAADAEQAVNALVKSSQASSATVADQAEAFRTGGAAASLFGFDVKQAAAMFAVFAEEGTKGAEAGTQARSLFLNSIRDTKASVAALREINTALGNPGEFSFFEDDGSVGNMVEKLQLMNIALDTFTDSKRVQVMKDIFGSYGLIGGAAIDSADGINTMVAAMDDTKSAEEVAEERLKSWNEQVGLLNSSIEGLYLEVLGPFVENVLKPMLPIVMEMINSFTEWVSTSDELGSAVIFLQLYLEVFGSIIQTVVGIVTALMNGDFSTALQNFNILIKQVFIGLHGHVSLAIGQMLMAFADFLAGLLTAGWDGLNALVILFQEAFHGIRVFLHGMFKGIVQVFIDGLNALAKLVGDFVKNILLPLLDKVAYTIIDRGGKIGRLRDKLAGMDWNYQFKNPIADLPAYTATGLGNRPDQSAISDAIYVLGEKQAGFGHSRLQEAASLVVVNVNAGNVVGSEEQLFNTINEGIRTGRVH